MPSTAHARMLAIAAGLAAALAGPLRAEVPEGTYISVDDYQLMEAGLIIPILEFVEVGEGLLSGSTIEAGYLHVLPDPRTMVDMLAVAVAMWGVDPDSLGRLDLPETRRITLSADLDVGEDRLRWTPELFVMTSHEPGRVAREEEPRLSPFLLASEAAETEGGTPGVAYRLDGDVLRVTGPDGREHSYRRDDPAIVRMIGILAADQSISIAENHRCMRPIAEVLAAGEPFAFSERAIAAIRSWIDAEAPEAAETFAEMERHGLGRLADAYYGRGSTALRHAGEYLQARIERTGGFAAMMEGWDGVTVLDQTDGVILQALMSMFYFDFDYESGELPFDTPLDVVELQQPQYEADPFSVINPWMVVYLDRYGWIPMLSRLMHEELALRCPAVNPRL